MSGEAAAPTPARQVDWGLTRGRDRALDDAIVALVQAGERVLDLGCGTGDLLLRLRMEKGIHERGIERDGDAVAEAIARGLAVVEGELGEWVGDLPAASYDLVILNQVLPLMEDPVGVIEGALRVGRRVAVSYPNFAHWARTLRGGRRIPVISSSREAAGSSSGRSRFACRSISGRCAGRSGPACPAIWDR